MFVLVIEGAGQAEMTSLFPLSPESCVERVASLTRRSSIDGCAVEGHPYAIEGYCAPTPSKASPPPRPRRIHWPTREEQSKARPNSWEARIVGGGGEVELGSFPYLSCILYSVWTGG